MTAKVTVASYIPEPLADEIRRMALKDNTTVSRWIETAIKRRVILEGNWKKEYEHQRGNGRGRKAEGDR